MTISNQLINPPINWRYWIVYYRFDDGRVMFFRGSRRTKIYIADLLCSKAGAWTWEQDYARLFQLEPKIELSMVAKKLGLQIRQKILDQTSYRGFDDTVLRTHLILPQK